MYRITGKSRFVSQILKQSILFIFGCSAIQSAQADELDYLFADSATKNETNILFILDASSSLIEPYLFHVSLNNPATNPSAADVLGLNVVRDEVLSTLVNASVIPISLEYYTDKFHCPPEYLTVVGEAMYTDCPVALVDRWYMMRIDLVRNIVNDTLPMMIGSNVGIMRTGLNNKSFVPYAESGFPAGVNRRTDYPDGSRDSNGAYVIQAMTPITSISDAQAIAQKMRTAYSFNDSNSAMSPLAESLFEAYQYYTGGRSPFNKSYATGWPQAHLDDIDRNAYKTSDINGDYKGLITECSSNNIILMSDGVPTYDWHANSQIAAVTGGSVTAPAPGPGVDETEDSLPAHTLIDELAHYMANNDMAPSIPGDQHINTHVISTWQFEFATSTTSDELLDVVASKGKGFHEHTSDMKGLHSAIETLVNKIASGQKTPKGYNFTLTNESGNPLNSLTDAYMTVWEYTNGQWLGNLRKYKVNNSGQIIDKNNSSVFDEDQVIKETSQSIWSTAADGNKVTSGGAAAKLGTIATNRYSIPESAMGKNKTIKQSNFLLGINNSAFSNNDVGASNQTDRNLYLNWAAGMDIYDIDNDADVSDIRQSLGDQINRAPVVAHYTGSSASPVVFTATNEGYLHAFDSQTGAQLYSFMPYQLLKKAKALGESSSEKIYGIDGEITLWHKDENDNFKLYSGQSVETGEKLMLFFGLGRGGSAIYALDITSRNNPKLAWMIDEKTSDFKNLGEAWGKIKPTAIKTGSTATQSVAIFGGGLDPKARKSNKSQQDGNAIYIINPENGEQLISISNKGADINLDEMKYSIVSSPALIDYNQDGLTDAFFVNDIRGQVFRCDFLGKQEIDLTCGLIGKSQKENEGMYFLTDLDVSFIGGTSDHPKRLIALSLSSGNRFEPTDSSASNRLVVMFDSNVSNRPASYKYADEKIIELDNMSKALASTISTDRHGWYYNLPKSGEKSFAKTLTFDHKIFLSTYQPAVSTSSSGCGAVEIGTASLYGFSIFNGSAYSSSSNPLIWTGPTGSLPQTPYMFTQAASNQLKGELHLGINDTSLDLVVDPVSRSYWMQHK